MQCSRHFVTIIHNYLSFIIHIQQSAGLCLWIFTCIYKFLTMYWSTHPYCHEPVPLSMMDHRESWKCEKLCSQVQEGKVKGWARSDCPEWHAQWYWIITFLFKRKLVWDWIPGITVRWLMWLDCWSMNECLLIDKQRLLINHLMSRASQGLMPLDIIIRNLLAHSIPQHPWVGVLPALKYAQTMYWSI